LSIFFFQAEDGIRDLIVTGVQTCALPISGSCSGGLNMIQADYDNDGDIDVLVLRGGWMKAGGRYPASLLRNNGDGTFEDVTEARSEERRVGKECRTRRTSA